MEADDEELDPSIDIIDTEQPNYASEELTKLGNRLGELTKQMEHLGK